MFDFLRRYQVCAEKSIKPSTFFVCSLLKYTNFASFDLLNDDKGHDSCLNAELAFC